MRPTGTLDPDAADDGGLEGLIGASSGKVSAGPLGRTRFFVLFPALRTGLLTLRPSVACRASLDQI
jgi:hypothetical protein